MEKAWLYLSQRRVIHSRGPTEGSGRQVRSTLMSMRSLLSATGLYIAFLLVPALPVSARGIDDTGKYDPSAAVSVPGKYTQSILCVAPIVTATLPPCSNAMTFTAIQAAVDAAQPYDEI